MNFFDKINRDAVRRGHQLPVEMYVINLCKLRHRSYSRFKFGHKSSSSSGGPGGDLRRFGSASHSGKNFKSFPFSEILYQRTKGQSWSGSRETEKFYARVVEEDKTRRAIQAKIISGLQQISWVP